MSRDGSKFINLREVLFREIMFFIKEKRKPRFNDFASDELILWRVNVASNTLRNKETAIEPYLNEKLEDPADTVGNTFRNVTGNNIRVVVGVPVIVQLVAEPPQNANGPSTLLIRKCYRDLTPVVFDTKIDKLRITGNPGIGKTYFGPIIFEGGKALVSDINGIERYLRRLDVWYIVDGKEPKEVNAKTILICSPRRDHYWNFAKYDGVVTLSVCSTGGGGIPRFVLQRANDSTYQDMLDKAITGCTMDIFDYVGELDAGDKISHMLVHICVNLPAGDDDDDDDDNDDDDGYDKRENISSSSGSQIQLDKNDNEAYTETIVKFASNYVRRQVTVQCEERIRERLLEKTKAGTPLLGIVYEYMAHKILRNGGNFDVHPLD
ncbi:unnamed protein product [Rhizophagus irregularis]|nr:unnamed protein product [Rhizophagus irregularis]